MTDDPNGDEYIPDIIFPDIKSLPENPAYTIIESDVRNAINFGLNQQQTLDAYRNAGLQFTDSKVRQIYNNAQADLAIGQEALTLPLEAEVNDNLRGLLTWQSDTKYLDTVALSVYDINRNEFKEILFRYYHDDSLTIQEIIDAARQTFNEPGSGSSQYLVAMTGSLAGSFMNSSTL